MLKDNVSLVALKKVYRALKEFQSDVREIPGRVSRHMNSVYSSCQSEIDMAERGIQDLQHKISDIELQIRAIQDKISRCNTDISVYEIRITQYKSEISGIKRLCPVTEEDMKYIDSSAADRVQALNNEIAFCRKEIAECQSRQDSLNTNLHEARMNRQRLEAELWQKQSRLYRMRSAFSEVQFRFSDLEAEMSRFCGSAVERSGANASSVDRCIDRLEEYWNTNL